MIYALEPVFGGLFGYAVGEVFDLSDGVGALVILAGVIIASLPRHVDKVLRRCASLKAFVLTSGLGEK